MRALLRCCADACGARRPAAPRGAAVDQLGAYPFPPLGTKLLRRFERLHAVGLVHEAMHEAATRSEEDTGAGAADDLVDDLLDSAA